MTEKKIMEMIHARVDAQRKKMEECIRLGICPLCWENLAKWHNAPILRYGDFWAITANDHPYEGTKIHLLAIYKHHINSIDQVEVAAENELFRLFSLFCKKNKIVGASILMRTGEMNYTGATLAHLHAHFISGVSREEVEKFSEIKYPNSFIISVLGYKIPK
ncbi:MAG: hypothetical protein JW740_00365 [Candidatus Zambryskibacteria bacterium]|nr:hypothetical protein [Candidatus Zambryskibacteria bacterium]